MVQLPPIPESVRPALAILRKYHFWMLAALVPLILVPLLFLANASLRSRIQTARSQIDSRFSALRSVEGQNPHPNEAWSTKIVANTRRTKLDTLQAWTSFWNGQEALRQWPPALGADFVQRAAVLKAGGTLPRKLLERYQDSVRQLVRELPARMGSDEHMRDEATDVNEDPRPGGGPPRAGAQAVRRLVTWFPDDQRRIYQSFNWQKPPSTTQVMLAQEELWVYGLFCDAIARLNRSAAGPYNAPVTNVVQLAIGYDAVEEMPGGTGRITIPQAVGGEAAPAMEADGAGPAARLSRPPHPRFGRDGVSGSGREKAAGTVGMGEGTASADDALKNWIYVDFDGKPLMASDLATSQAARMVHLMPFVVRLTMDQRSLDALLVDLASSSIPIDVRQVRINPDRKTGGPGFDSPAGLARPAGGQPGTVVVDRPRLHDIRVEIRGTVGLATPPNPQALGLEEADLKPPDDEEQEPPVDAPVDAEPTP